MITHLNKYRTYCLSGREPWKVTVAERAISSLPRTEGFLGCAAFSAETGGHHIQRALAAAQAKSDEAVLKKKMKLFCLFVPETEGKRQWEGQKTGVKKQDSVKWSCVGEGHPKVQGPGAQRWACSEHLCVNTRSVCGFWLCPARCGCSVTGLLAASHPTPSQLWVLAAAPLWGIAPRRFHLPAPLSSRLSDKGRAEGCPPSAPREPDPRERPSAKSSTFANVCARWS